MLEPIAAGACVHTHILGMGEHTQDYAMAQADTPLPMLDQTRTFDGYHRTDGKVGTRNYLRMLTTVNCSATVAKLVAEAASRDPWFQSLENVDGIVPIVHGTGCAMDLKGEAYHLLFRTLQGYAQQANFGGILLIGLGCEAMQVPALVGAGRLRTDNNFPHMTIQQEGGTRLTIKAALRELREMAEIANKVTRQPAPLNHIVVDLQCGGSDGYSGITATPALGGGVGSVGAARWHHDPVGNARDLRRGTPVDPACGDACDCRSHDRADQVVGGRATPPVMAARWITTRPPSTSAAD